MSVDLHLDESLPFEEFALQAMAIVTLRNGNQCWAFWVHQSKSPYNKGGYELRYSSGDEAPYTRDGIFCGADRGLDIVAIERGILGTEAEARGLKQLDWPGAK